MSNIANNQNRWEWLPQGLQGWPESGEILVKPISSTFSPPHPVDGHRPHLKVGDNFLRAPIVALGRRGLPLLQDSDRSLGLLDHPQDAIQHLINIHLKQV